MYGSDGGAGGTKEGGGNEAGEVTGARLGVMQVQLLRCIAWLWWG